VSSKSKSLTLAIVCVAVTPFLLFGQVVGLILASMILAEDNNPIWAKILSIVVWVLIGALAVTLPVWTYIVGKKSQIKAAQIIGGIVGIIAIALQVYLILSLVTGRFLFP